MKRADSSHPAEKKKKPLGGCLRYLTEDDLKRICAMTRLELFCREKIGLFYSRSAIPLGLPAPSVLAENKIEVVNMATHPRYKSLDEQEMHNRELRTAELALLPQTATQEDDLARRFPVGLVKTRQHGAWWFETRKRRPTGSKQANIIGMFGFKSVLTCWVETYDPQNMELQKTKAIEREQFPGEEERSKEKMAWGSDHEIDGTATIVHRMGDAFNLTYYETTLSPITLDKELMDLVRATLLSLPEPLKVSEWNDELEREWQQVLMSSPDGDVVLTMSREFLESLELHRYRAHANAADEGDNDCIVADRPLRCKVEIKCPYGERDPNGSLWSKFKYYYYSQCQYHLLTDPASAFCLAGCWTPAVTRLWIILRNRAYWRLALPFVVYFHRCGQLGVAPSEDFYNKRERDTQTLKAMCDEGVTEAIHLADYASVFSAQRDQELEPLFAHRFPPPVSETKTCV